MTKGLKSTPSLLYCSLYLEFLASSHRLDMGGLLNVGRSTCVGNAIIHHQLLSSMAQTIEEGVTLSTVFSNHATKTRVHGLEASVFCLTLTLFAYFLLGDTAAVAG
jgi:hypothetical protein